MANETITYKFVAVDGITPYELARVLQNGRYSMTQEEYDELPEDLKPYFSAVEVE
jgi:hypothetical protein